MLADKKEQIAYIKENYPEITDNRINDAHWDIFCPNCKIFRGFNVIREDYVRERTFGGYDADWDAPKIIYFRCPVCDMYKIWLVFNFSEQIEVEGKKKWIDRFYKITSIPAEGLEDIDELPKEPPSLRNAYREAIRSMDANAYMAAAAMFRRALQIITRDILKVPPSNLADELNNAVGKVYNGVKITKNFADVGYIIKEAGNQGAHPDEDPDLLEFTPKDAEDLQNIFMELVSELFVAPEAERKAKEEFLKRRKINPK